MERFDSLIYPWLRGRVYYTAQHPSLHVSQFFSFLKRDWIKLIMTAENIARIFIILLKIFLIFFFPKTVDIPNTLIKCCPSFLVMIMF